MIPGLRAVHEPRRQARRCSGEGFVAEQALKQGRLSLANFGGGATELVGMMLPREMRQRRDLRSIHSIRIGRVQSRDAPEQ